MKKAYMTPSTVAVEIAIKNQLLTISGGTTGIGYGGVDDGTNIPASRELDEFFSNWDDDNY